MYDVYLHGYIIIIRIRRINMQHPSISAYLLKMGVLTAGTTRRREARHHVLITHNSHQQAVEPRLVDVLARVVDPSQRSHRLANALELLRVAHRVDGRLRPQVQEKCAKRSVPQGCYDCYVQDSNSVARQAEILHQASQVAITEQHHARTVRSTTYAAHETE